MLELSKESLEILHHCADFNPAHYNRNKALEEAVEFQEVLIKLATKHPGNKKRPQEAEALKEYGDVIYRGLVALMNLFPQSSIEKLMEEVTAHIERKLARLREFKDEGSYQGGL